MSHSIMDLVLFDQAIEHISRVSRILQRPCGNALLVGVGGSGKQSLSKLACFLCNMNLVQINITSDYSIMDLKEFLKELYCSAGVKPALPICFMMTDSHIINEKFLVYINDTLSSGFIPDLFTSEELDSILGSKALRMNAKLEGVPESRDSLTDFFIEQVRSNLHIILCFSPIGNVFRGRVKKFPGIINCTSVDWFHHWSKDALVSVALKFLDGTDFPDSVPSEVRENIAHHMADVHITSTSECLRYYDMTRRFNNTTPKSFLELIDSYKFLLSSKGAALQQQISRLSTGLNILNTTDEDVKVMRDTLIQRMKDVEEKKVAVETLLEDMGQQRGEAKELQQVADGERKKAQAAATTAQEIQREAEDKLAEATPAMERAADAVDCLDKSSLTELKHMSKPPAGVDKVTTAVLMMKGEKSDYSWDAAKKMMKDINAFKSSLEEFDANHISEDILKRVAPLLEDATFNPKAMAKKSTAASNLCNWVINIIAYNTVYRKVQPLMLTLQDAKNKKVAAEKELKAAVSIVSECNDRLKELQNRYVAATDEKSKVISALTRCKDRLALAERLVNGLVSEKVRWGTELDALVIAQGTLVGDAMLGAAFISYCGAFNASFRLHLWRDTWKMDLEGREIPLTKDITPLEVLTTEGVRTSWITEGLPRDRVSTESGSIVVSSKRWPLLIDPQIQGVKWLQEHEIKSRGAENVVMLQVSTKNWIKKLINAIQSGGTVIIENCSEILDPSLDPILVRAVYKKGRNLFLKFGDEEIEYDQDFRLFLQTKLNNPKYKPEVAAQCTIVNFTVTEEGLEDQILAQVVAAEQPDLESEKIQLQKEFNRYKIQLLDLENTLLAKLANAPDDILGDVGLIESLEATKFTVDGVNVAVKAAKLTEEGINKAREIYRPTAVEGAMLYFLITDLQSIDPMYQYSLDSFMVVFYKAILDTIDEMSHHERAIALRSNIRISIFKWISRGLFEEHKLVFLSSIVFQLLCRGTIGNKTGFSTDLLEFLINGSTELESNVTKNSINWLPENIWQSLNSLSNLDVFETFISDLCESGPRFREWYNCVSPEDEKLPLKWRELDKEPFKKLVAIKCFRPDRMTSAISKFIQSTLPDGVDFIECDGNLNSFQILEDVSSNASATRLVLFIVSPGVDVVADMEKLLQSTDRVRGVDFHEISLGQGQEVLAADTLAKAHKKGHWVLLNNIHLMPKWLHILDAMLDKFMHEGSHKDFRLFLTSDPTDCIPNSLLQRSTKLTNEPPRGLKANLKRALCSFDKSDLDTMDTRERGILFGLMYFHSLMLERKQFGVTGFNMQYPFGISDLKSSAIVLGNYMDSVSGKIPWADIKYIFGEILYGGHIVDSMDRKVCLTYLEYYFQDDLLDEMEMIPFADTYNHDIGKVVSFKAPASVSFDKYLEIIELDLPEETPLSFGLHPNAELGFRSDQSQNLFATIRELDDRVIAKVSQSGQGTVAESLLQDIVDIFAEVFFDEDDMNDILVEDPTPYQSVWIQECTRMNRLIKEILRSLAELELGFKGGLMFSDSMEILMKDLYSNRVPQGWKDISYPTLRALSSWIVDLEHRVRQLNTIAANRYESSACVWIAGLFNPQSFLTSVMQTAAQTGKLELDKLSIQTEVTKKDREDIDKPARDGVFIDGLFIDGARWDSTASSITDSKPKEIYSSMPVIRVSAAISDRVVQRGWYSCPMYRTQQRGPTYIINAQLRSKSPPNKWILAGVVLLMDVAN